MSGPRLRPHFDLFVSAPEEPVTRRLEAHFATGGEMWAGHIVGRHAQLVIRRRNRNIWSPWLTFAIEPEKGGTLLSGRFAPHPSGWTLYLALYGMVIISMVGLGFFGLSQWMAGLPATMLWSLPVGAALVVALYASALIGQRLSAGEMDSMRAFVLAGFEGVDTEWRVPRARLESDEEGVESAARSAPTKARRVAS